MATTDQAPEGRRSTHEAILETLASAVLSLEAGGAVTTFNSAAAAITGLAPQAVIGRTFAEIFLPIEGAEGFCETVLDAVYNGTLVRRRVVEATFPGGKRTLSMSVSEVARGAGGSTSLAVVFDDISEIRELRQKELSLAHEVDEQHRQLKEAYRRLEQQNRDLADARKRTRLARFGGTAALLLLLGALTVFALDLRPDRTAPGEGQAAPRRNEDPCGRAATPPSRRHGDRPTRAPTRNRRHESDDGKDRRGSRGLRRERRSGSGPGRTRRDGNDRATPGGGGHLHRGPRASRASLELGRERRGIQGTPQRDQGAHRPRGQPQSARRNGLPPGARRDPDRRARSRRAQLREPPTRP